MPYDQKKKKFDGAGEADPEPQQEDLAAEGGFEDAQSPSKLPFDRKSALFGEKQDNSVPEPADTDNLEESDVPEQPASPSKLDFRSKSKLFDVPDVQTTQKPIGTKRAVQIEDNPASPSKMSLGAKISKFGGGD